MIVKKHLSCQKIAACVRLFFQMSNVGLQIQRFYMAFWVAGASDAEAAVAADLADQLAGVWIVACKRSSHAWGNISPECQDIFDAGRTEPVKLAFDLFPVGRNTGKMGHGADPVLLFQFRGHGYGMPAGSAACAVGNAHIVRMESADFFYCLCHVLVITVRFWRKDFK